MKKSRENLINLLLGPLKAGVHFGHRTSKTHPKMKPYISGVRNTVHVIDVTKTHAMLEEALAAVRQGIAEGKALFLVGTKVQIKKLVEETARFCNLPYVSERWVGGTFTNFPTILKRIKYMNDLRKQEEEGELAKYTKQEQARLRKSKEDLEKAFGGLRDVTQPPSMVFICDLDQNNLTAREARRKGIKIIAVCDTNIDPTGIDYPIPANDDAVSSARYILGKLKEAVLSAKSAAPAPSEETQEKA
ncbi:MAG: 30S ribosomal protein S2 [Candidatus Wildermuthbacteria bacterium]|nr:30S ribosomal protein S2 [Candidatus Wildermuthbacteria bacterium]